MFEFLSPKPLRLLVVDDDEVDRMSVLRVLRTITTTVEITDVANATDALALLREREFDCAILDLYMPPRDGHWLLREARTAGVTTPVVMLTGQGDEQTAVTLMKAGAADYIPKSALSHARLGQSIRQAIRVHRAEQQAHRAEAALRASEERLRHAMRAANLGIWDFDPQTMQLECDERCKQLYGLPPEEHVDYDLLVSAVHPEDRERVLDASRRALAGEDDGECSVEYRAIGITDATERWLASDGRVLFDASGRPIRFAGTVLDISERKRSEQERMRLLEAERQARAAAETAIRTRDDLIAVVSHDLRNPLGAVVTATQLLQRLGVENPRLQRQFEIILRSARTMERLISDLLDLASLDAQKLSVEVKPCEADVLLRDAGQLFAPLVEAKGLRFTLETVGGPLSAPCDRERILQVLSNLVGNALKFTERGSIALRARAHDDEVLFEVADTGAGIDAEHLPHIFDRYFQGKQGRRQGVGLGLSIAKGIVEAHGGRVWVQSAPGVGTTFFFTLPRCARVAGASAGDAGTGGTLLAAPPP
jgi:PAS domain S-box-containing protein